MGKGKEEAADAALRFASKLSADDVLDLVKSSELGLTQEEADARLRKHGLNVPTTQKPPTWWQLLYHSTATPFNILLAVLAVISAGVPPPQWSTFAILLVMIVISAALRFWQERKSQRKAIQLQQSSVTRVSALRQVLGKSAIVSVNVQELVPGDILCLNAGDVIPADCVLLESAGFAVAQSSLTGESEPQAKSTSPVEVSSREDTALFDLENILLMSTNAISGAAKACIVRTGDGTYLASIMKCLNQSPKANAFQKGMLRVSYTMIAFSLVLVLIVFAIQGATTRDWLQAIVFSISVGVGVVPEMLPAIVNANLARGAYVLSKQKAIVKRIDAIQNLGAMDILCSDKTGTLTQDEVAVYSAEDQHGQASTKVLSLAFANATHQAGKKNSMDAAIIKRGTQQELKTGAPVASIPFTFETRRSGLVLQTERDEDHLLIVKGAIEEMLGLCGYYADDARSSVLTEDVRRAIVQRCSDLNNNGLRILGVITATVDTLFTPSQTSIDELNQFFVFEGILTFLDPPKVDSADAIANLRDLGVETKVLTGDNLGVSLRVCQDVHLASPGQELQYVTGPELEAMDPEEFTSTVERCSVLAKLSPMQKAQVIAALQRRGHTVGMLGDGINDCVALRAADVGISVDTAQSVAKDCASVLLTLKELDIVVQGVQTGRITHGNTIKYIKMVLSSNFGNVLSILIASAWLPFEPMSSLQILLQNLLYDVSQLALPWDRMDAEFLAAPQTWQMRDLIRFVLVLGPTSSTIDMCTFLLNWFYYGIQSADDPVGVARFQTHWFLEGLLTQTIIVHLLRTAKVPVLQSRAAPPLVVSTTAIAVIGIVLPYLPGLSEALGFVRPADSFLGFLAAEIVLYCVLVQGVKMVYKKLFHKWL